MPKFAVINAHPNGGALSPEERVYIRSIIGVPEDARMDLYTTSETRFTELSKRLVNGITEVEQNKNIFKCKELRVLYEAYGKQGDDMLEIKGKTNFSPDKVRARLAAMIQKIVFPKAEQQPNEQIFTEIKQDKKSETISFPRAIFNALDNNEADEFAS